MIKIHPNNEHSYHFSLQTENGDILLISVDFADKMELDKMLRQLETKPLTSSDFERKTTTEGKFLFILKDSDGKPIGRSEAYDSEAGLENGIKNLRERIKSLM